ncbi:uncharacterized protein A4U43_C02F20030 [Asparagus officinalis]|uniref:Uncharacterized protein n=1 Tax=Asparagus officinalis TaxID=4686 RepID=A0A5P1FKB8_ASPOF|nr:uncharacterized protein A4U43_C02F20030 [Asparagus officinalis]
MKPNLTDDGGGVAIDDDEDVGRGRMLVEWLAVETTVGDRLDGRGRCRLDNQDRVEAGIEAAKGNCGVAKPPRGLEIE